MTKSELNPVENKLKIYFNIDNEWIKISYPKCETTTT